MRSMVYIGQSRRGQVPVTVTSTLARQLGPGAGSRSSQWRMHYWAGVLEEAGGAKNQK